MIDERKSFSCSITSQSNKRLWRNGERNGKITEDEGMNYFADKDKNPSAITLL